MVTLWFIFVLSANATYGMGFVTPELCEVRALDMNTRAGKQVVQCVAKEVQSKGR